MRALAPLLAAVLCSCASILQPGPDMIPVSSEPQGAKVYVGNNPHPVAVTPTTLALDRRGVDYEYVGFWDGYGIRIRLEHEGCHPQEVMVHHVLNGWTFGNIVLGGAIGMLIDLASGNHVKWPEDALHVKLTPLSEPAPAMVRSDAVLASRAESASAAKSKETKAPTHEEIW